jgi:hypothetical protein
MKNRAQACLGLVALTVVTVLVAAGEARSGNEASSHLLATVTRAGQVSLRNAAGRRVSTIPAGAYVVTVRDRSKRQNFHLAGPTPIDKRTGIRFVGAVRWTLTFPAGAYRYYSDRKPDGLKLLRVNG